jgi:hypothetical protein
MRACKQRSVGRRQRRDARACMQQAIQGAGGRGALAGGGSQGIQRMHARLARHEVEDSLSQMFDEILAEGAEVQRMAPPVATIRTPLLPHQQEALAWMVRRENSGRLPPFWQARPAAAGVRAHMHACVTCICRIAPPWQARYRSRAAQVRNASPGTHPSRLSIMHAPHACNLMFAQTEVRRKRPASQKVLACAAACMLGMHAGRRGCTGELPELHHQLCLA